MPVSFDYECKKCGIMELHKPMMDPHPKRCPKCSSKIERLFSVPAFRQAPDHEWDQANNGRGRYISQYQTKPGPANDPNCFFRSQAEAIEYGKKNGYTVTRVDRT